MEQPPCRPWLSPWYAGTYGTPIELTLLIFLSFIFNIGSMTGLQPEDLI